MRELVFRDCTVIHDKKVPDVFGSEDSSAFFTARGDIDGDGTDEVVVCNSSGPVAIIKRSTVYKISNESRIGSICSVHVCALTGSTRSEIVVFNLMGTCTIYRFEGTLGNADASQKFISEQISSHTIRASTDLECENDVHIHEIKLTAISRQSGLPANAAAAHIFM
jgi:hypothetical protein